MKLNILIGGGAGQGINKVTGIVSAILSKYGHFTFNYRDYPSLIRGGHNFNVLTISDSRIGSNESKLDGIIALDNKTLDLHKNELKSDGFSIGAKGFEDLGRNINIALAGALIKILGIDQNLLLEEIELEFPKKPEPKLAAEKGFTSQDSKYNLKKLDHKIKISFGSKAIAQGAINSEIALYIAYPMTPATNTMHELASMQEKEKFLVFQAENELAVANAALGASFAGARTMIGTSGGGFDLMSESFSMQGMTGIPLVVYLAARPGPGSGMPTYTMQGDLDIALRAGHGEFPRVVIAPGDPIEAEEKTNEAFYLSEKFGTLAIILSDKHLAESEFSTDRKANFPIPVEMKRGVPGEFICRGTSYEHDDFGVSTEDPKEAKLGADCRIKRYQQIQKESEKFEMIKVHGKKDSKNLVIGWGSTKGAILDAIEGEDFKFLQVLYMKPISDEIIEHIKKAEKVILVENNLTGQLGRLIREATGIKIEKRLLKYDGRPFLSDELNKLLKGV
ncbi:2-oxoacid:acceptor oxidoreductase family protein [Patescibacteria group bacterium]